MLGVRFPLGAFEMLSEGGHSAACAKHIPIEKPAPPSNPPRFSAVYSLAHSAQALFGKQSPEGSNGGGGLAVNVRDNWANPDRVGVRAPLGALN